MEEFKIEKGIPIPSIFNKNVMYPLSKMEVGDSFVIKRPVSQKSKPSMSSITTFMKNNPSYKFINRKIGHGIWRVWRVEVDGKVSEGTKTVVPNKITKEEEKGSKFSEKEHQEIISLLVSGNSQSKVANKLGKRLQDVKDCVQFLKKRGDLYTSGYTTAIKYSTKPERVDSL